MAPRILWLHRQVSAVGAYRCSYPAKLLKAQGHDITHFDVPYRALKPTFHEFLSQNVGKFDLMIVDKAIDPADLPLLAGFRHVSEGMRMIVDFDDDWVNVPWWNQAHGSYKPGNTIFEASKSHLKLAEMASVSTPTLAERFKDRAHAIQCVENGIDPSEWEGLPTNPERAGDPCLRILYGGAAGHFGDMDEAKIGLEAVLRNPPAPVRLLCFGASPNWIYELSKEFPGRVVRLPWVEFADYPQAVAWGGFDLAIAPLADHPFNEAKSNIKWLEAGIQGIPFLCSDIGPYKSIPNGCAVRVSNTPVQWSEALRNLLSDGDLRARLKKQAHQAVMDSWTVGHKAQQWLDLIETALSRPRIETLADTRLPSEAQMEGTMP